MQITLPPPPHCPSHRHLCNLASLPINSVNGVEAQLLVFPPVDAGVSWVSRPQTGGSRISLSNGKKAEPKFQEFFCAFASLLFVFELVYHFMFRHLAWLTRW